MQRQQHNTATYVAQWKVLEQNLEFAEASALKIKDLCFNGCMGVFNILLVTFHIKAK